MKTFDQFLREWTEHQLLLHKLAAELPYGQTNSYTLEAIAGNPVTHPDTLHHLSKHPNVMLRTLVAGNKSCYPHTLHKLSNDESDYVKRKVAHNIATPTHTLLQMQSNFVGRPGHEYDELVKMNVERNMDNREGRTPWGKAHVNVMHPNWGWVPNSLMKTFKRLYEAKKTKTATKGPKLSAVQQSQEVELHRSRPPSMMTGHPNMHVIHGAMGPQDEASFGQMKQQMMQMLHQVDPHAAQAVAQRTSVAHTRGGGQLMHNQGTFTYQNNEKGFGFIIPKDYEDYQKILGSVTKMHQQGRFQSMTDITSKKHPALPNHGNDIEGEAREIPDRLDTIKAIRRKK